MQKATHLKEFQKRLPQDIIIEDETIFDFTDDEYISILSWIKFFKAHYKQHGKSELPSVVFPIISKRLRLDFGLYHLPDKNGRYVIYISANGKLLDGTIKKNVSVTELITTWQL